MVTTTVVAMVAHPATASTAYVPMNKENKLERVSGTERDSGKGKAYNIVSCWSHYHRRKCEYLTLNG